MASTTPIDPRHTHLWRRLAAAFLEEIVEMTRGEGIFAALFPIAAFGYQYLSGGVSPGHALSIVLPSLWSILGVASFFVVQAARRVWREETNWWDNWEPVLVGSEKPRRPSAGKLLSVASGVVVVFVALIVTTAIFIPTQAVENADLESVVVVPTSPRN